MLFAGVFIFFANHNILVEMKKKNPEKKQLELKFKNEATELSFADISEAPRTLYYPQMKVGNELDTTAVLNKLFYS